MESYARKVVTLLGLVGSGNPQNLPVGLNVGDDEFYFSDIQRLKETLLKNYDKHLRPARTHRETVKVGLGLSLTHIEVNELASQFTVQGWLTAVWKDERLSWNSSDYDELDVLHLPGHLVWQPDIVLYNNADAGDVGHFAESHLLAYSDGSVLWVPSTRLPALCRFDLRYWPEDTQVCNLKMGSWAHDGGKLELYKYAEQVDKNYIYIDNGEWEIINSSVTLNVVEYPCCPNITYPDVTFEIAIKRRSQLYNVTIFTPAIIVVMLTLASFLLPPNAGEKVMLGVVDMAILCLYLVQFNTILPAMGNHVPLIIQVYKNTLIAVGVSVVIGIITISYTRAPRATGPHPYLVKLFTGFFGCMLCLGSVIPLVTRANVPVQDTLRMSGLLQGSDNQSLAEEEMAYGRAPAYSFQTEPKVRLQGRINAEWYLLACAVDRIVFFVYWLTLGIMVVSM